MKKKYVLIKILSLFEKMIRKTKIDYDALVTILNLKLTLDDRKSTPLMGGDPGKNKMQGMKANLLMQAFVGLFLGLIMILPLDLFYKIATVVSIDFFFMVMIMISDFSSVLLDVRDKNIIMTKPVNNQTMNAARIIHIVYYMLLMFLALNLVSIVVGTYKHGASFLVSYMIMMVFLSFFIVFMATILYSVLLNRFNGEKLKDIINMFQIVLSVITIIAYQLMGRIFEFVDFNIKLTISWWTYLLPPSWFAGLFKVMVEHDFTPHFVIMAVLSLCVPIILGIVLIKTILPKFESYLSKLQIEDGVFVKKDTLVARVKEWIYQHITKDHIERAFIRFTDYNLSRDRRLKLMIYPNLTMSYIFPFLMILPFLQNKGSLAEGFQSLQGSVAYLSIYLVMVIYTSNFEFVQYSEHFEAAFIYDSFPIANKHVILRGAMKAYYIKYVLPGMFFLSLIFALICGPSAYAGILFMNLVCILILSIRVNLFKLELPFSKQIGTTGNKNLGTTFAFMGICSGVALIHFLVLKDSVVMTGIHCLIVIGLIKGIDWHIGKKYLKQLNTDYSIS